MQNIFLDILPIFGGCIIYELGLMFWSTYGWATFSPRTYMYVLLNCFLSYVVVWSKCNHCLNYVQRLHFLSGTFTYNTGVTGNQSFKAQDLDPRDQGSHSESCLRPWLVSPHPSHRNFPLETLHGR